MTVDKCQKSIYSHSFPESHILHVLLFVFQRWHQSGGLSKKYEGFSQMLRRERVSFNFIFPARAGSKASFSD